MKKLFKIRILNTKITLILIISTALILNILVFYYFYRELNNLRGVIGTNRIENKSISKEELEILNGELTKKIEELEKRNTELVGRVTKLERVPALLGETLKSCEYLYSAYPKFPSSYENQLKQCENSYNKLKSSF